ncbi:hypothetical protein kuro4_00260 [Gelria sp. Kuro-4]|nr:hypothetical protein kuro4_00260 [Gelria sp. Kuro-4]
MSEKVCPLRRVKTTDVCYSRVEVDAVFRPCYREKCAWWMGNLEGCALVDMANSIAVMLDALCTRGVKVRKDE